MSRLLGAGSLLVLLPLLFPAAPAPAVEFVPPGLVQLAWEPAEGPVLVYGLFLSQDGGAFSELPVVVTAEPRASLVVPSRARLVVRVAAYDGRGRRGPFSPESELIVGMNEPVAGAGSRNLVDFDGDGRTDLLWREVGGERTVVWLMDADDPWLLDELPVARHERIEACADLDGDGRTDLLVADTTTGERHAWLMDGSELRERRRLDTPAPPLDEDDPEWHFATAGDFDGDGDADLLFRFEGLARALYLEGSQVVEEAYLTGLGPRLPRAAAPDLDGDGAADIFWWDPTSGATEAWLLVDGVVTNRWPSSAPFGGAFVGAGDVDADGRDDLVWRLPDDALRVWLMNGVLDDRAFDPWPTAQGWTPRLLGDLDGDGRSNDLVLRTASGNNDRLRMEDTTGRVRASVLPWAPANWQLVGY